MNKFKKLFTDKRFIYGSGSLAMLAGFITIAVLVNVIVGVLSDKLTMKIDLTQNKIFKLSQQTIDIVKGISESVDIILFETAGAEDPKTKELLQRYVNLNGNLKLRVEDPVKNPMSAQKYNSNNAKISAGSIVFDNGKKFKLVSSYDLRAYNSYTQQNDQYQAENKLTTALLTLFKSSDMSVAFTRGHGEETVSSAEQLLKDDGINVETVTTLSEGFPDKCDMIFIVSPKSDFTAEEIEGIDRYLKGGKSIQAYFDIQAPELPKLFEYLSDNGISVQRNAVFEGDSKRVINNTQLWFMPAVKEHPITSAIISNELSVVTLANMEVKPLWDTKNSIEIKTLLESSDKSFAQFADGTAAKGPISLAVIAERTYEDSKISRVFVMGTSAFINNDLVTANKDFFLGSVNWQVDSSEPLSIRPKSLSSSKLELTQQDFIIWLIALVVFIPVIILVLGLATWLRRRHL